MSATGGALIIGCGILAALLLIRSVYVAFVEPWLQKIADDLHGGGQ